MPDTETKQKNKQRPPRLPLARCDESCGNCKHNGRTWIKNDEVVVVCRKLLVEIGLIKK